MGRQPTKGDGAGDEGEDGVESLVVIGGHDVAV